MIRAAWMTKGNPRNRSGGCSMWLSSEESVRFPVVNQSGSFLIRYHGDIIEAQPVRGHIIPLTVSREKLAPFTP